MPYMGALQQALPYTLEVVSSLPVAVTVISIRRDRISEVESLVLDSTAGIQTRSIASNVARVLFQVHGNTGDSFLVKVAQATMRLEVPASPDASFAIDVL